MLDSESNKWIDAMNAEIQSMMDNMVWVLVDLPPGCKTVGSRWLFKKKTDMDGIVHVYKARLVAKGYTQLYGVDYEETFSPVADIRRWCGSWVQSVSNTKICSWFIVEILFTNLELNAICDAGFETDRDDTKSQTGYVFVLNGGAVDWKSSKQSTTAMSATESEYIAASEAAMERGGGGVQKGATDTIKGRYHLVRGEMLKLGEIRILKVHTDNNLADPFTKALSNRKLTQHARGMGLRPASSFM
ncbi:retrotransposon protein, putative, ty1-copia subclass [Tanacetum coccineum]